MHMKTKLPVAGLVLILICGFSSLAAAAGGAELYKAKTCNACHGEDAKTPMLPVYPKLAGQRPEYLLAQMKDIKSGARNNGQSAAMKAIIANVEEADMKAIADWLGGL